MDREDSKKENIELDELIKLFREIYPLNFLINFIKPLVKVKLIIYLSKNLEKLIGVLILFYNRRAHGTKIIIFQ